MQSLAAFLVNAKRPYRKSLAAELCFGALCGAGVILVRLALSRLAPDVGPFAPVFPLILISTLYGHWRAGLLAGAIAFVWGWWHVVPYSESFVLPRGSGSAHVAINAISAVIVLIFAALFRRAIVSALQERDQEIAHRALLMRELEHRTKNNFALVVSLLEGQKRQEDDPRVVQALDLARARIHSFARAYANLAHSQGEGGIVAMKPYLTEVVSHFTKGGFPDNVAVTVEVGDCLLPREVAVGIGLFVNEALTNCAKHAFPDHRPGHVSVSMRHDNGCGWEVIVEDDGIGFDGSNGDPQTGERNASRGSKLMQAFAQQAGATLTVESSAEGTRMRLASECQADRVNEGT